MKLLSKKGIILILSMGILISCKNQLGITGLDNFRFDSGIVAHKMKSKNITYKDSARVQVNCKNGITSWINSPTKPRPNDPNWTQCSGFKAIYIPLNHGENNVKLWFKNNKEIVSPTPTLIAMIYRTNQVELLSNSPQTSGLFSSEILVLKDSNVLVLDKGDSTNATSSGSLNLYDGITGKLIFSFTGSNSNDFSTAKLMQLNNGHILLTCPYFDDGSNTDAGKIFVLNSKTGALVSSFKGDNINDNFGGSSVIKLSNDNVVVASENDDNAGIVNAGSVKIINPNTGNIIFSFYGDNTNDYLGSTRIQEVQPGYLAITSENDTVGGLSQAGTIKIVDINTGLITYQQSGTSAEEKLSSNGKIFPLSNGNIITKATSAVIAGVKGAGRVRIVNPTTGVVLREIVGSGKKDRIGKSKITETSNGTIIIAEEKADVAGVKDSGIIYLINSSTGSILKQISGDSTYDNFGNYVKELDNGNILVSLKYDDFAGLTNVGSLRILNPTTGAEICSIYGDNAYDYFSRNITLLKNGNIVASSPYDDNTGLTNNGSITVINPNNCNVISQYNGDDSLDQFSDQGITELENGNIAITSLIDRIGGALRGTIKVINPSTGSLVFQFVATTSNDLSLAKIIELNNQNLVLSTPYEDSGGIVNSGSVRIFSPTGNVLHQVVGDNASDMIGRSNFLKTFNDNIVIGSEYDDVNGVSNAGSIKIINTNTGVIEFKISGNSPSDFVGRKIEIVNGEQLITKTPTEDISGLGSAGSIRIIDLETYQLHYSLEGTKVAEQVGQGDSDCIKNQYLMTLICSTPTTDNNGVINSGKVVMVPLR
jgi:hypothetical protein